MCIRLSVVRIFIAAFLVCGVQCSFERMANFDMENLMARIAILQVVSTSRHITQGVIDMLEERWDDGKNVLSGRSLVVGGDPYELRIAIPEGGAWKVGDVVAQGANIKVAGVDKRGPRVLIESAQSREVRWKIGWCGGGKVGKNQVELFDGKSLKEWMVKRRAKHTDKRYLVVDDGEITAQTPPGSDHHYIQLLTEDE